MNRKILSFIFVIILLFIALAYAVNTNIDSTDAGFDQQLGEPFVDSSNGTQVPLEANMEATEADVVLKQDTQTETVEVHSSPFYSKNLEIHFIDVGQADCILIELPNGENVLIDAGNTADSRTIINYLNSENIDDIEYMILTHPHEDHIGSAADILNTFKVNKVYLPDATTTTQTFEDTLLAIKNNNVTAVQAKGGMVIINIPDEIKLEIIAPNSSTYGELNEYSIVTKLTYKETAYLFTGDAESVSESEMIKSNYKLDCDLLKVGHHGGSTSTTQSFLDAVTPRYAVISVGKDNSYGHPHEETLNRLANIGCMVYRTDEQGTIIVSSNGQNITINKAASTIALTPVQDESVISTIVQDDSIITTTAPINSNVLNDSTAKYIGNKNTLKFHYSSCSSVDTMNDNNKVYFSDRQDAIDKGYVPCKRCNP